jgi:polysaccharide biosynthesis protein PslJ
MMSPLATREQARRRTEPHRWDRLAAPAVAWLLVAALAAAAGVAVALNVVAGLAVAVLVLAFGIFVADPILVAVVVLPGGILIQRVGGSSTNLSVADLLVFVGAFVCLFHIEWSKAPHLRRFLRGIVWYEAVLVLVVVAHPFRGDMVEWIHRFSYLAGSTLVGWVIASHGRAHQAIRLYLWGAGLLALIAVEHAVTGHFQPAQWGDYQKNAIGAVMWVAIVTSHLNPPWARISRTETRAIEVLCLFGLLASQSRQSAILVVLALGTAILLHSDVRGRSKMIIFIAVPIIGIVYYSFVLAFQNNPQFNSVAIRFGQIDAAIHVWHLSPIFGLGMRFYNLPQYLTVTAPPNSLVDNLASTGVIGSLAFFFLVIVTLRAMNSLPRIYGTLGLVVLLAHYVDGMFDTFWIGALSITPFLIAGISLGMADADPDGDRIPDLLAQEAASKWHPAHRKPRSAAARG